MSAAPPRVSLDTNILVRFALDDHPRLSALARQLLQDRDCHVSVLALAEVGYVLQSFYRVPLDRLLMMARGLMQLPRLEFENAARLGKALDAVAAGMDWFDALLWASVPDHVAIATFDRRFSRLAHKLALQPAVSCELQPATR